MIRFIWNFNKFEDIFLLTGGAGYFDINNKCVPTRICSIKYWYGFSSFNSNRIIIITFMIIYFRLIGKKANEI